jgi:hypothetical protein
MQFEKDMTSPHKALFEQARALLLTIEGITEVRKERITTYVNHGGAICHVRTMEHGIDIGFLKGARMRDELGLLKGSGNVMRVLPLEEMNEPALMYYLAQAFQLNRQKIDAA